MSHTKLIENTQLLNNGWQVSQVNGNCSAPLSVPGDVHSALLRAGKITDPYWRDTELDLDWVHESEWLACTQFEFVSEKCASEKPTDAKLRHTLSFASLDTQAIVYLNGQEVGRCENQFLRWDFDVSDALLVGRNTLEVRFLSNSKIASEKAEQSEFPIPYIAQNNRIAHFNFLRKTQCHAGWDWNIALAPLGIYGDVTLKTHHALRLDDVLFRQRHERHEGHENNATTTATHTAVLEADLLFKTYSPTQAKAQLRIDGQVVTIEQQVYPDENRITLSARIDNPQLWWPLGEGSQHLYDVEVQLGDETRQYKMGLREVVLDTSPDAIGNRFALRVNGHDVFMRGANWIPADALPERGTPEAVRDLLQSAVDANMNMIRIWGGGQYEADWFYELCDELGLMVWQDFMFSCNTYPAHQRSWLELVRMEARQQIRRLSQFACVALWCGDNELVGALGWFKETLENRDRYLAIYDRLNHALEEAVEDENPTIPFWASSPSVGRLNFGDGWHIDTAGDMHFWDVWHSAKEFEHYRTVRPRFASEFGFQSFPSMRVIEQFSEPKDRNVSSRVMEIHQRNDGGNARIVETLQRYFQFPNRFEDMVYLSQVSQGLAMKTAIEFWRSNSPRCMGALYWQLNDTWPVASWASLEYGGGWKSTQYLAKRFFTPVMLTAQPDEATGDIVLFGVNDTRSAVSLKLTIEKVSVSGGVVAPLSKLTVSCTSGCASELHRIETAALAEDEFLYFSWHDDAGLHTGENDYLPRRPKEYDFEAPHIAVEIKGNEITLSSDKPALFVTYDHGSPMVYSDNCFTLLPNRPKIIKVMRERGAVFDTATKPISTLMGNQQAL